MVGSFLNLSSICDGAPMESKCGSRSHVRQHRASWNLVGDSLLANEESVATSRCSLVVELGDGFLFRFAGKRHQSRFAPGAPGKRFGTRLDYRWQLRN